jgi:murein DD-endopeptidase / murein LD-carboxypeptidase
VAGISLVIMLMPLNKAQILKGSGLFIFVIASTILLSSCVLFRPGINKEAEAQKKERERDNALIKKYEDLTGLRINIKRSLTLYKAIDRWMGTPYRYGTMTHKGTDCSGFTCSIYKEVYKISLSRGTEDQFHKDTRHIARWSLKEGDLVFFRIEKGRKVSHVGIYLGNHKFVHASVKKGVCISDLTDKYYIEHFRKAGRVKKDIARLNE